MIIIDYLKGTKNKGSIIINDTYEKNVYIAVTIATSKDFKSLKGAEKYMNKFGYIKICGV